jgi:hypothetical protein
MSVDEKKSLIRIRTARKGTQQDSLICLMGF